MDQKNELEERIKAKRKRLEAKLHEMKADSSEEAKEKVDRLKTRMSELQDYLKSGVDNLTEKGAKHLNSILKEVE